MKSRALTLSILCFALLFVSFTVFKTDAYQATTQRVDFRRDIQPIFSQFCIECHGPSQQMRGYRLDQRKYAMSGAVSRVIVPGSSASSRLFHRLIGKSFGPQMPLNEALAPEQIDLIKRWIDQGAEWPEDVAEKTALSRPNPDAERLISALKKWRQIDIPQTHIPDFKEWKSQGPRWYDGADVCRTPR